LGLQCSIHLQRLIHIKVISSRCCDYPSVQKLPPFRERTPAQLRAQAQEHREAADREASPDTAARLLRLAERYETLAALREELQVAAN
jgi:hypothetical protein